MPTTRIRAGYDTWVDSANPTSRHPRDNRLKLKDTTSYGFIYFPLGPELRNKTIEWAYLHAYGRGTGWSATLSGQRVTQAWDAGTLQFKDLPTVGTTTASLTQTNAVDLTDWALDVKSLIQEFSSGGRWRGIRLKVDSATARLFNSLNAAGDKPWLEIKWTEAPAEPVDQSPAGGRAVSISRPVLSWSNENSPDGTEISAAQVQIDPSANGITPAYDSGTVLTDLAEFDLGQSAYAGLANGATTQWRVRVQNETGEWSTWSDWVSFSRVDKGTVTITTPGSTIAEHTPPVAWTTSFTQTAWQILVTDPADASIVLHDTGRKTGTTQDYTIPAKDDRTGARILVDDRDYRLVVRAWDSVDRETTPGDPRWATGVAVFNYNDDPTINKVVNLNASQVGMTPYVDLTWQRSTTPDAWTIVVNDKVVDAAIPGADLLVSGEYYKYRYKDAAPNVEAAFKVKPTVNGTTAASPTVSVTPTPAGVWVLGPDDIDVLITGKDLGSFSMPDRGTTFVLPQSRNPVRITQGVGGYAGTISGRLATTQGLTAEQWRNRLLKIKKRGEPVTLIVGGESFRATIFDINVEPSRDGGQTRAASFEFFQIGAVDWLD